MRTVHEGVWQPGDRAESRYHHLDVGVPDGYRQLHVELSYDTHAGVLDLGCFDPDGAFRGWSGGARTEFTIGESWATPGYLSGPLPGGAWRVALGLHRVPPGGLEYRVTAEARRDERERPAEPEAAPWPSRPGRAGTPLPAPAGYRWLAGDLHAHTVHSDGTLRVGELARLAVASGLDFLAVTDHNTVSHHPELAASQGITLLPGQEVTTDRGHANVYGAIGWVDFRTPADSWLSTVEQRGGLLSVNHPLAADCAWLHPMSRRPRLAEVWHSGWWDRTWGAPLAWLLAWEPGTVPLGGSDFHDPAQGISPGRPTTWVLCPVDDPHEATPELVLSALGSGAVALGESPDGPALLRLGEELAAIDADGSLLVDFTGRRRPVRGNRASLPAGPGVHWLEDDRARILAISS